MGKEGIQEMPANMVAVAFVAALAAVMISGYGPNADAQAIAVSPERFCLALAISAFPEGPLARRPTIIQTR